MGFDVTFHPVRLEKEGSVMRDLLLGRRSPAEVVKMLPNCPDDIASIIEEQLKAMLVDHETNEHLACVASFRLAMLAGCIRPYWFARGQAITFYLEQGTKRSGVFTPFLEWLGEKWRLRPDPSSGLLYDSWSGSGVIERPKEFLEWFDKQKFGDAFDEEGIEAVHRCADYAIRHGCQMLEATDVYSPMGGTFTNPANARAHFLRNIDQR